MLSHFSIWLLSTNFVIIRKSNRMSVSEAFGEVADLIARMAPEKVIALKASPHMSERVENLVQRKKDGQITTEEIVELEQLLALDMFIGLTKARARMLMTA